MMEITTAELLRRFWADVAAQDAAALSAYFLPDALIRWHCTNECFTVPEYIQANCAYPGRWQGSVERVELLGPLAVTATRVWTDGDAASFHAVSFFRLSGQKIAALDEYWGDDGPPPPWRQALGLGRLIQEYLP